MRRTVGEEHLGHDEEAVDAARVRVDCDGFQQAVRAAALGLFGRAAVESPHGTVFEREVGGIAINNFSFSAEAGDGRVTVEPDVFQFQFGHICNDQ